MKSRLTTKVLSFMAMACLLLSTNSYATKAISGKVSDFTLKSTTGENIRLNELRGQVVMINFWATWCVPCITEMPLLEKLHKKYERAGFKLLGVNIDKTKNEKKVSKYAVDKKISFPILLDPKSSVFQDIQKTVAKNTTMGMPTSVFIDRDGNARFIHVSYKTGDENSYRRIVKKLIRE